MQHRTQERTLSIYGYQYFDRSDREEVHAGDVDVLPGVHGDEELDESHPGDVPSDQEHPHHTVIVPGIWGTEEVPVETK